MADEYTPESHFPSAVPEGSSNASGNVGATPTPQQMPTRSPLPTPQTPETPQSVPVRQVTPSTQTSQPTQVQPTQIQQSVSAQQSTQVQSPTVSAQQSAQASAAQQASSQQTTTQQPTTQVPHATQVRQAVASSQAATNAQPANVRVVKQRKGIGALGGFLLALLGGLIGAGALFAALTLTGRLNSGTVTIDPTDSGVSQTITINPSDENISVSKAVAAKALPSVVSFQVYTSDGGGLGSGVVINENGDVITNHHVVEGAQSIVGTIGDKSYEGTVVGEDASSDLAVVHLELNGDSVSPIEIGDSSTLEVGDWVMTIGSPYGLDQSCSSGIVSSLYRSTMLTSVSGNTIYTNLIQTDAAINPGNSGGALVDSQGRLVGINSLNASYSGGSSGVGFAIPVNYAMQVANAIVAGNPVLHAYIGLSLGSVASQDMYGMQLDNIQGAYVVNVAQGGPAEEAGIQEGDVIVSMDGKQISSADALILAVRGHDIGDTVTVTVNRDGEELNFEVTLTSDEALQGIDDVSEDRRDEYDFPGEFGGQDIRE